jgi:hypothetical protein
LREISPKPISMTDMFRFTTVESLANYLRAPAGAPDATERTLSQAQKRAALRRDRMRTARAESA